MKTVATPEQLGGRQSLFVVAVLTVFALLGAASVSGWGSDAQPEPQLPTEATARGDTAGSGSIPPDLAITAPQSGGGGGGGENATRKVDLSRSFSMALAQNEALYPPSFGRWNTSCLCRAECIAEGERDRAKLGDVNVWGRQALRAFIGDVMAPWHKTGGITLHHHASMVACSYHTKSRHNPSGVWLHISGRNSTALRVMVDGYHRQKRIERYVRAVVAKAKEPLPPMVVYISTTDIPCNPDIPYLTFFSRRGVRGVTIPDDSFLGGMQKNWTAATAELRRVAALTEFASRKRVAFFRGSPTHKLRQQVMETAAADPTLLNRTDVKLAVMERFKSLSVPLVNHSAYRYLIAIRGRTASSRDKYLNAIGSTILWAFPEASDAAADQSWFQFYHTLWKPWVNYAPFTPSTLKCTLDVLDAHDGAAASMAKAAEEVADFMTQDLVDEYLLETLRGYAAAQKYEVQADPVEFLRTFFYFVKKWYRNTQIMPDDRNPMKYYLASWVKRRVRQLMSCRVNSTQSFSYHRPTACWYT